jgi:2-polyprenyl-6-hydroxyphenyl methylase/3-demethylubiquinone-9 3-methyltransferase
LLAALVPGSEGRLGFPAFYDRCSPAEIENALLENGFVVGAIETSYCQSDYFEFFFPLYAVSTAYELAVRSLGLRNLAAIVLVVARRP